MAKGRNGLFCGTYQRLRPGIRPPWLVAGEIDRNRELPGFRPRPSGQMDKVSGFRHDRTGERTLPPQGGIIEKVERFNGSFGFLECLFGLCGERSAAAQGALLMAGTDQPSPWWSPARHADRKPFLLARNAITRAVRAWFEEQGFAEVETGILQVSPGNEIASACAAHRTDQRRRHAEDALFADVAGVRREETARRR